jgi:hypothetical protein
MAILRVSRLSALLIAAACAGLAALDEWREIPYDTIQFANGTERKGTIVEERTDGTVVFKEDRADGTATYAKDAYRSVAYRRMAPEIVASEGKRLLEAGNDAMLARLFRWGLEHNAVDAATRLAVDALKRRPGARELLAVTLPALAAKGEHAVVEKLARAGVQADPHWDDGNQYVVAALLGQARNADALIYARDWLARSPTALRANLMVAEAEEQGGDARSARERWRKTWELHKNLDGALGFARCSLAVGAYPDAKRAGEALVAAGHQPAESRAWLAGACAALGEDSRSAQLLDGLKADELSAKGRQAAEYARGLIAFRQGRLDEAARQWEGVGTPAADLAAAIARRKEPTRVDALSEELRPAARLMAISARIEGKRAKEALSVIDPNLVGRHAFLFRAAKVLESGGSAEAVREVGAARTPEAARWQLYGHLIANRLAEAEAVAASLGPADGYAAACRIYLAAAKGDPEGARALFRVAQGQKGAPAAYLAELGKRYADADDIVQSEPFDWPEGDLLASGWEGSAPGTDIRIHAKGGRLLFDGTQKEAGISRAGLLVPGARLRSARLLFDLSAAGSATAGLELLDAARKNGIAIAARPGSAKLAWRQLVQGAWSTWSDLPFPAAVVTGIALDRSGDRIFAVDPANPVNRQQLSDVLGKIQGDWWLGAFTEAEPGSALALAVDELVIRLRPGK